MKRQHAVILLSLALALAVGFYIYKAPASSETKKIADSVAEPTPVARDDESKALADLSQTPDTAAASKTTEASAKAVDETEAESASMPSEELSQSIKQNLAKARAVLQKKSALEKAKAEDLHHMPRETLDAAKRLAEIAELEAQHPEQATSFRDFYLECARDDSTITVTRAQCLDRYLRAAKLDVAAQKDFLSEFPEEIVRLVEALQ